MGFLIERIHTFIMMKIDTIIKSVSNEFLKRQIKSVDISLVVLFVINTIDLLLKSILKFKK
ncbi:MAG: hypothetical protein ACJAYN_001093 [Bermanella sp.]|jgi:hypothetical protein